MRLIASTLLTTFLLSGCGSSGSTTAVSTAVKPTPAPTTPTTSEEVHLIQPKEIPAYIDNYKAQRQALSLQIDGKETPFTFLEMLMDENLLLAKYSEGALLIGFDFQNDKALASLSINKSSSGDINTILDNPDAVLTGQNIEVTQSGDNMIYTGSVLDPNTQGLFNVRLVINESLISGGTSQIDVQGNNAVITGDLGTEFYIQLTQLINQHPNVDTLVLQNIGGSVNDAINLHSGRLARSAQLTTLMPANGEAYSGGVDLYAAGYKRVYQPGGKLGVHSWCCVDGKDAGQLGRDHSAHGSQLTFVREMLGETLGPEFYFFTIEAAPIDGIHLMTQDEINKYFIANQ